MKRFNIFGSGVFFATVGILLSPLASHARSFPTLEELLNNSYHVSVGDFALLQPQYESYFSNEFDIRIAGTTLAPIVENFLYDGANFNCNYDQQTGELTITVLTLKPIASGPWLAFSPQEGGFTGITLANGNPLKLKFDAEANLSIPDFEIGTYVTSPEPAISEVYAQYGNITTEYLGKDFGPEAEVQKSFAGRYAFTGVKTDYTDPLNPVESPLDFELVIEYDEESLWPNRLVEIAGYTLAPDVVEYKNTLYTVKGNTLSYMSALSNGVSFELEEGVSSDDPEIAYVNSYNFGSSNTRHWNQNEDSIIFTLESETEYSLQPFTIWHNYWTEQHNTDENGEEYNTVVNVKELVMKWEGTMAGIEGIEIDGEDKEPVRYFNLNGIEVSNPTQGLYIRLQGGKAKKILVRDE